MTTLKDDGYLETDDPVVVACFLGQTVMPVDKSFTGQLDAIEFDEPFGVSTGRDEMVDVETILIPAKTVAEVIKSKAIDAVIREIMFDGGTVADGPSMKHWLRKHAGPGA